MPDDTRHTTENQADRTRLIHRTLVRRAPFWHGYTLRELVPFVIPPLLGVVLLGLPMLPPGSLGPITGGILTAEAALLLLHRRCPGHRRLPTWLFHRVRWGIRSKTASVYGSATRDSTYSNRHGETRQLPRVRKVRAFGVERVDGALVGAIEISPANMALRDADAWDHAAAGLADLVDSSLGFDIQLFVTTESVSDASHLDALARRVGDPDVKRLPMLRALVERTLVRYRDETADFERSTISPETSSESQVATTRTDGHDDRHRRYYAIVAVTDDDIEGTDADRQNPHGWWDRRSIVGRFTTLRAEPSPDDAGLSRQKRRLLEERLAALERGVEEMPRCGADQVSPRALSEVIHDYWTAPGANGLSNGTPSRPAETSNEATRRMTAPKTEERPAALAPAGVSWHRDAATLDDTRHVRTFWIEQFPEHPENGLFERLLLDDELQADLSIHIEPFPTQEARDVVEDWISTRASTRNDGDVFHAADTGDVIDRARHIRTLLRKHETGLYRVGVFIRLSAPSEEVLERRTRTLETILRDAPANCLPKRVVHEPEAGLVTTSPIAVNALGRERCSAMTGSAVGALFPFSSNYLRMEGGIEYGRHGHNASSVRLDPWSLETGHSELVTGTPGAGKTHGAQARALRTLQRHEDVTQIIIDPVGDMRGMARALDATELTVSGTTALNPCALYPTNDEVDGTNGFDPVAAKKEAVFGVIENFLSSRDIDLELHSGVVTYALDRMYAEAAVEPTEPSTHTPENSPTFRDMLAVLDTLAERPEVHDVPTNDGVDSVIANRLSEYAADLAIALQPFREGSTYANLAERTDFELLGGDDRVVYVDLQAAEGTSEGLGQQSFLMQLLLGQVYEEAKQADERVEVIVDEAHYLFADDANLAFLNQIARHQRHAGLRLVLLSQTLQEFYDADVAEEIAGMCPIKIHHREPDLDDVTAERTDLTDDQRWFVKHAAAGSETAGYSEALVRVDEQGEYPLSISTSEVERLLIEESASVEKATCLAHHAANQAKLRLEDLLEEASVQSEICDRASLPPTETVRHLETGLSDETLVEAVARAVDDAAGVSTPSPGDERAPGESCASTTDADTTAPSIDSDD